MGMCGNVCAVLQRYCEEREAFLQWIVTGNETLVHHCEPVSKCQSLDWKHTSPRMKKFRSVLSAGRVMLMLF